MAEVASGATPITPGVQSADYQKAGELLLARHKGLKEKASSANGELGTLFKSIEDDLGVNKWAAKAAIQLKNMDEARAQDRIRALFGMLRVFDLMPQADLVDLAQKRAEADRDPDLGLNPDEKGEGDETKTLGNDNMSDEDRQRAEDAASFEEAETPKSKKAKGGLSGARHLGTA